MTRFSNKKGQLTERLVLRLTPEMKELLQNYAVDEEVSMNSFILTLISEEIKKRGKANGH